MDIRNKHWIKAQLIIISALIFIAFPANAGQQTVIVRGRVVDERNNKPVPGLGVYMVNKKYGRSTQKTTDNRGRFVFYDVPVSREVYYLEIYKAKQLLYRMPKTIIHDTEIPEIRL